MRRCERSELSKVELHQCPLDKQGQTESGRSNPASSAGESVSAGSRGRCRLWRRSGPGSGREKGTSWLTFRPSRDQCLSELAEPCAQTTWRAPEGSFSVAGPMVRIPSPPAESPRLAGFCPPKARSRLFARVCGPSRCSPVSRDGYRAVHGADRREYLCRANFQYRGADAAVA
jgi:hypothetical protein